jgi:probable rRNA maturation factor
MPVDILIRDSVKKDFEELLGLQEFEGICMRLLKELKLEDRELSVLITDDQEMKQLNSQYRSIDKPTDVLSFSLSQGDPAPEEHSNLLGDVVISLPYFKQQALDSDVNCKQELVRLVIHGSLHLLGYDHEGTDAQAKEMFVEEQRLFRKLNEN